MEIHPEDLPRSDAVRGAVEHPVHLDRLTMHHPRRRFGLGGRVFQDGGYLLPFAPDTGKYSVSGRLARLFLWVLGWGREPDGRDSLSIHAACSSSREKTSAALGYHGSRTSEKAVSVADEGMGVPGKVALTKNPPLFRRRARLGMQTPDHLRVWKPSDG